MSVIGDLLVDKFFRTTLTASVEINATDFFVEDVTGFPVPTGNEYFYLTLVESDVAQTIKIGAVDVGNKKLTAFAGDKADSRFGVSDSRAELWFTAEAFQDIQTYLTGLATSSYPGVDDSTVEANPTLRVKGAGILSAHIGLDQVNNSHLANNAVQALQIQAGAVGNAKLDTDLDAAKLTAGTLPKDRVQNINFENIAYTYGGTPSGGSPGDIHFTFKA